MVDQIEGSLRSGSALSSFLILWRARTPMGPIDEAVHGSHGPSLCFCKLDMSCRMPSQDPEARYTITEGYIQAEYFSGVSANSWPTGQGFECPSVQHTLQHTSLPHRPATGSPGRSYSVLRAVSAAPSL